MANERIAACGLYVYDSENVEDNGLAFRTAVDSEELQTAPGDEFGTRLTYGLDR